MKKNIIKILLLLSLCTFWVFFMPIYSTNAVEVTVTEWVPWCTGSTVTTDGTYKCNVEKWFGSITRILWEIIKYATFIAWLGAVLFIVINGILYSMSWLNTGLKDEAKKRITKTLLWLVVLMLSWLILNMIAPWIYVL